MSDAPTVLRFPKGDVAEPVAAVRSVGGVDVLPRPGKGRSRSSSSASGRSPGCRSTWRRSSPPRATRCVSSTRAGCFPSARRLVELARSAGAVAVVEDNLVSGGIGSAVTFALREAGVDVPVHTFGIPKRFLAHASRSELLEELGLTADTVVAGLAPKLSTH